MTGAMFLPRRPLHEGSCLFCDYRYAANTPIACNLAIIRHHCERTKGTASDRDMATQHSRPTG